MNHPNLEADSQHIEQEKSSHTHQPHRASTHHFHHDSHLPQIQHHHSQNHHHHTQNQYHHPQNQQHHPQNHSHHHDDNHPHHNNHPHHFDVSTTDEQKTDPPHHHYPVHTPHHHSPVHTPHHHSPVHTPHHHSPVHTPHSDTHAASRHFAPLHFPSDQQSSNATHSSKKSPTHSLKDSSPTTGDRCEDIPIRSDRRDPMEQNPMPKHVSMPVISEHDKTSQPPLQILVEDTSSLNRSNLNKNVSHAIKPQSSPSLNTISKEKPRISVTSLNKDTLSVHSATSILQKKKKIENAKQKRKRFLYFAFILSLLASILWIIVFCTNGWFSRNFSSKKYFDYLNTERFKRHIDNPLELQTFQPNNNKQNNALEISDKHKTVCRIKTRSLMEAKKMTLESQYGGIWRMCSSYVEREGVECMFLEQYPSEDALKKRVNSHDVITFRRACAAMGIICIAILVLSNAFIYYSILQHRYVYKRLSGSLLIGAAACILVCIEIFQGLLAKEQDHIYPQTSASLGICYMLAWLCMGMLLISAGVIFFYSRKQKYDSMDDRPVIIGRI